MIHRRKTRWVAGLSCAVLVCGLAGCGSGSNSAAPMMRLAVSLSSRTVVVPSDGVPVRIQLTIQSTSETALVNLVGLPGGVQETYAATDTNPSGLLTFSAAKTTKAGTYMPTILVNSAGEMASLQFTLVVTPASSE